MTSLRKVLSPSVTLTLKRRLLARFSALRFLRESFKVTLTLPAGGGAVNILGPVRRKLLLEPLFTFFALLRLILPLVIGVATNV